MLLPEHWSVIQMAHLNTGLVFLMVGVHNRKILDVIQILVQYLIAIENQNIQQPDLNNVNTGIQLPTVFSVPKKSVSNIKQLRAYFQ